MKLLALDVGDRRIGVAVSDATGLIATPLAVIRRTSKVEDCRKIAELMREQGAQGLVIGHPVNRDGSAGSQARRVERYAVALAEGLKAVGLDVPALLWDERMSTQRAQESMVAAGRKARHRQGWVDAAAAAVILQDYLDEKQPAFVAKQT
jgi:putative Holliday junction resolvase